MSTCPSCGAVSLWDLDEDVDCPACKVWPGDADEDMVAGADR
jgi:uncharacterized Zn finger protein (UPF0148 family)